MFDTIILNMRRIIVLEILGLFIFLSLIGFLAGFLWLFIYKTGDQNKFPAATSKTQHIAVLSRSEWDSKREYYFSIVNNHNPRIALEKVREEIKTNNPLSRNCHELTHEIGHTAFNKYKDFGKAMQYQDEVCNSGYMHGVIESYFEKNKSDISGAVKNACKSYKKNNFIAWECFHGIGHGVMFATDNNMPKSINLCAKLPNAFQYSACANGVFMQNFNSDEFIHPSKFLSSKNFFYPCSTLNLQDMKNCYLYSPIYFLSKHNNDYLEAFKWCNTAPIAFINVCAMGVGTEMIKQNINNPKLVMQICLKASQNEKEACIEGMVGLYVYHYGNLSAAENLCKTLGVDAKKACSNSINSLKPLFL